MIGGINSHSLTPLHSYHGRCRCDCVQPLRLLIVGRPKPRRCSWNHIQAWRCAATRDPCRPQWRPVAAAQLGRW